MTGRRGGSGAGRGREPGRDGRGRSARRRRSNGGPFGAGAGLAGLGRIEGDYEVRTVQPFQAIKEYTCPGCQQTVAPGVGHIVAVPRHDPDLRRHWHRPCWDRRGSRRPGR